MNRKLVSNALDKIHQQFAIIRCHVEELDDQEAEDLLDTMQIGCLGPMRKFRLYLDIPYDWHGET